MMWKQYYVKYAIKFDNYSEWLNKTNLMSVNSIENWKDLK